MYKLVSVSDKTNIEFICKFFIENNEKIISTGGTYNYLIEKLPEYKSSIIKVSEITNFPEILNGRVKTLHPKILGSLLCKYNNDDHINELTKHVIPHINGIIVNLYPFKETIEKHKNNPNAHETIIENIDIGGVTLLRAAAKNYEHILTITSSNDYEEVMTNYKEPNINLRQKLAKNAFKHVLDYDKYIFNYFESLDDKNLKNNVQKDDIIRHYVIDMKLKYGCNPYQSEASINTFNNNNPFEIINGTCGYINILDAIYSWQLVKELSETLNMKCAASYKHTSPAGVGTSKPLSPLLKKIYDVENIELSELGIAFIRARNSDPMSSFGDFIALSDTVDVCTAKLIKRYISDGIVAPDYTPEALNILKSKRSGNYLILKVDKNYENTNEYETRELFGISLIQNVNNYKMDKNNIGELVTSNNNNLTEEDKNNLIIANISLKYAQSNNVSYAYDGQLIGLAAGQQNRVDCVRLAGEKSKIWWLRHHPKVLNIYNLFKENVKRQEKQNAIIRYIQGDMTEIEFNDWKQLFTEPPNMMNNEEKEAFIDNIKDSVSLASDAFFPFRDNIDVASKYNVKNIIQPGGSSADETIINTCNKYSIHMIFTNKRLFYH